MKHAKKALLLLFLLVTPLLLAGVLPPAINNEVKATISPVPTKVNVPSYEELTPILAYNDVDMDNYASALSWDGDGSPGTPYIIDGYNITSDGTCIEIRDTVRAFEIRNCYLSSISGSSLIGIQIKNVTQAAIVDTFVLNKYWCIDIINTPAPYIENCTIHDCYTITLSNCTGATITECDIYDNANDGIYLYKCNDSLISNNEISDNGGTGLYLESSDFLTITTNTIAKNRNEGIDLDTCNNATIRDNDIWENNFPGSHAGLYIYYGHYNLIEANQIWNNSDTGIYTDNSNNNWIIDNQIYNHSRLGIYTYESHSSSMTGNDIWGNGWDLDPYASGIYVDYSNDSLIENNRIWYNTAHGIYLDDVADVIVLHNEIWDNTPTGIYVFESERVEISSNHIFNNTDTGIYLYGPGYSDVVIRENEINGNGYLLTSPLGLAGIQLIAYTDCIIEDNHVYNNSDTGILIQGNDNTIIGNEVYNTNGNGIEVIMVVDCVVAENTIYDNEDGILLYSISTNVTDNIVFDNNIGIHLTSSQFCLLFGNDIGWNGNNSLQEYGQPNNLWYNNVTDVGNWWSDYSGTGVYYVSNGTHTIYPDMYPSKSLDLVEPAPIDFEILETGNVIVWEASALNPSHYEVFVDSASVLIETWDGNDIEFLADGLAHGLHTIEVEVYHISGHSTGDSTTADVEDLTPPSLDGPGHISIVLGDRVSAYYTATDPSGITGWAVNDTVNFAIDSTGALTGISDLPVGEYAIRIEVSDTFGHTAHLDVTITVNAPSGGDFPTIMLLIVGTGAAVVVVVVLVMILKKR